LLGYSLAVPPGPMNALIAAWSLKSFRHGFAVGAGAMSADLLLVLLTLALSTALKSLGEVYYAPFYAAGGALFLYLAYKIAASKPPKESGSGGRSPARGYLLGLSFGLIIRTKSAGGSPRGLALLPNSAWNGQPASSPQSSCG